MISSRPGRCTTAQEGGKRGWPDARTGTKVREDPTETGGLGQTERTSEHVEHASYDKHQLATTRALVDAVMAAVAAGDTFAARAAAKGLLASFEALAG